MPPIQTFEDIKAWQAGRSLTNHVYKVSADRPFSRDFALCDQIRRASISITSNIAEGFERERDGEFVQFLRYAKASAGEVRSQLYIAVTSHFVEAEYDQEYIDRAEFDSLHREAEDTIRLIRGLIRYLEK